MPLIPRVRVASSGVIQSTKSAAPSSTGRILGQLGLVGDRNLLRLVHTELRLLGTKPSDPDRHRLRHRLPTQPSHGARLSWGAVVDPVSLWPANRCSGYPTR